MFESLASKFSGAFSSLRAKGKISPADIDTVCTQIRTALLDSDVAVQVVDMFILDIREKSLGALPTLQSGSNQANA
uniref:signal recognition particle receptor subunit alpha n=1 Tax=Candidatus Planktophila sp. TaxID=2175601 RepID=UPI004049A3D3